MSDKKKRSEKALPPEKLLGLSLGTKAFTGEIAIGVVTSAAKQKSTKWHLLKIESGVVQKVDVLEQDRGSTVNELHAAIVISAESEIWTQAAVDFRSLLAQVEGLKFSISGRFSFFVRHLVSVVELMRAFAGFYSHSESRTNPAASE